jgi:flavin-binding protein dodecin
MPGNPSRRTHEEEPMAGIYKKVEIVGLSDVSFAEAVKVAVEEAGKTIRHMSWFEVVEQRGRIHEGKVAEFQVTIRIGFKLER